MLVFPSVARSCVCQGTCCVWRVATEIEWCRLLNRMSLRSTAYPRKTERRCRTRSTSVMVEPFAVTPKPRGTSYHSYLPFSLRGGSGKWWPASERLILIGDPVDEDEDEE